MTMPAGSLRPARPKVSFVVPVLNGETYLPRCLDAIRRLGPESANYEILVMDNGSTDGTLAILKEANVQYSVFAAITVGALRNRGAHIAQGEYLAFVDSDVEVAPGWLEAGLAALQDTAVVGAGCFPGVPNDATWVQRVWDVHQRSRRPDGTRDVSWLSSMNVIIRRADFLAVGGFAESLQTAEDVDLCYRLAGRGRIVYSPAMSAIHWGEARDIRIFWRKEVWRGKGNLRGLRLHGLRWDELPSVGYPLYVLGAVVFLMIGVTLDLWRGWPRLAPAGLAALGLPAFVLAITTAWQSRRLVLLPQLALLYALYGLARAKAVLSSSS